MTQESGKDAIVRISEPLRNAIKAHIQERALKGERPKPTIASAIQAGWDLQQAVDREALARMRKSGATISEVVKLGLDTLELMS